MLLMAANTSYKRTIKTNVVGRARHILFHS